MGKFPGLNLACRPLLLLPSFLPAGTNSLNSVFKWNACRFLVSLVGTACRKLGTVQNSWTISSSTNYRWGGSPSKKSTILLKFLDSGSTTPRILGMSGMSGTSNNFSLIHKNVFKTGKRKWCSPARADIIEWLDVRPKPGKFVSACYVTVECYISINKDMLRQWLRTWTG